MPNDFLPTKDGALLTWATNYSSLLTATPTVFGASAAQATALAALLTTFTTDMVTSTNPTTRTRSNIAAKNAARTPLKAMIRELARIINAYPTITNQQRIQLGLNPRSGTVSPINPPTESPVMEVVSAFGRTLKVRLHAQDTTRRGKPVGVVGASVYSFVGSAPPADITQWVAQGLTSRTAFDVEFPATTPAGSQVHLCAFWYNPRGQSGPACNPISAYIAGGVTAAQQQAA